MVTGYNLYTRAKIKRASRRKKRVPSKGGGGGVGDGGGAERQLSEKGEG